MISGNREDYLIEILRITKGEGKVKTNDLANKMKVSPASVSEMIKVLSDEGFVKYAKYRGAELTDSGLEYARRLRRKHDLMERFLIDVLDMEPDAAHEEAHKMEHAISDDSAQRICRIIGAPANNDCESCIEYDSSKEGCKTNTKLSDMKQSETGRISHLRCEEPSTIKKLISMGFVPGREVYIYSNISKCGPKVINIGNATFALDSETASSVFVEKGDD